MLRLENIVKEYPTGDEKVVALKGVDIEFRENEFVSILGPSGCGKTTLLNIIGGLDQYTSGDLIINGISTKKYKDRDWDSYRNHSIGFVFQSYNLIPHQSVLANVELALTISGVSRKERKRRAKEALIKVGLESQIHKKPNQMSGGQMQRVAIARALVNNPTILLADEPTGALDTETSAQVMDILSEIAADKLVIMVTHNPELAQIYSTRIIRLLDGKIISDTMPVSDSDEKQETSDYKDAPKLWLDNGASKEITVKEESITLEPTDTGVTYIESDKEIRARKKLERKQAKEDKKAARKAAKAARPPKTSMKLATALSLSLNNLMTKKARTFLTAFAGSIGIIGIALILSLSNGVQLYIDGVEEDTLSSYPITIEKTTIDMTSFMTSMAETQNSSVEHSDDRIYTNQIMTSFMDIMLKEVATNNLSDFKKFIENNPEKFEGLTTDIHYGYSTQMNVYKADLENGIYQVNPGQVLSGFGMSGRSSMMMTNTEVWQRLINNDDLLKDQYEVVYGRMPEKYDEVVLIVNGNNEVTDYTLYSLGILDSKELTDTFTRMVMGEDVSFPEPQSYPVEEICGLKFKLLLNSDYFAKEGDIWVNKKDNEAYLLNKLNNAHEINLVGIIRSTSSAASNGLAGTIGYRTDLMEYLIDEVNSSQIVKEQKENPDVDIFSGIKFDVNEDDFKITQEMLEDYIASASPEEQAELNASIEQMKSYGMSDDKILETFATLFTQEKTDATYEGNLKKMGVSDREDPSSINIYPKDFESKDTIADIIKEYNKGLDEDEKITYTDYVGLIMSSVTTIINAISYILIAFVAISLVVSSIMIGIITYISVLERTKEIGILRAIGASKKDISRVFNAETLIIGFTAGALGILITELLLIPINQIIYHFTDISGIAQLPPMAGLILVAISMALTFIAGLFPSRIAAKKDPVVALRTE